MQYIESSVNSYFDLIYAIHENINLKLGNDNTITIT